MQLPFRSSRSFTLVELLVVISIITIVAGATVPGFTSYIKSRENTQTREELKSDLRTLQNKALSNDSYETTLVGPLVAGETSTLARFWTIKFYEGTSTYRMFVDYDDTPNGAAPTHCGSMPTEATSTATDSRYRAKENLPTGAIFSNGGDLCLYFSMDTGDITSSNNAANGSIQYTYNSINYTINWNKGGLISN